MGEEHRRHRRLFMNAPVVVKVVSRPDAFCWRRPALTALTRNVSANGMQLEIELAEPVPSGSVLKLQIQIIERGCTVTLRLLADVTWSRERPGGGCLAGVRLRDKPRDAVAEWQRTLYEEIRRHDA